MTTDEVRKSRLVGLSIRQQSWELETLKQRNHSAVEILHRANEALQKSEAAIGTTEQVLNQMMLGQTFDISAVQTTQAYLAEKQQEQKALRSDAKRASQRAEQAAQQLKYASLSIKALERIKESSDRMISREQEKRLLEDNLELWVQRVYLRGEE